MRMQFDFAVQCDTCGNSVHAEFHEEQVRTITTLVIVIEPCQTCLDAAKEVAREEADET